MEKLRKSVGISLTAKPSEKSEREQKNVNTYDDTKDEGIALFFQGPALVNPEC